MSNSLEVLIPLHNQVERLILEPCSPMETKLVNAVAIIVSIMVNERQQEAAKGTARQRRREAQMRRFKKPSTPIPPSPEKKG